MAFAIGFSIFLVLTAVWAVLLVRFAIRESRRRSASASDRPSGRLDEKGSGSGEGEPPEAAGG